MKLKSLQTAKNFVDTAELCSAVLHFIRNCGEEDLNFHTSQ
jgi:hypothetical protein